MFTKKEKIKGIILSNQEAYVKCVTLYQGLSIPRIYHGHSILRRSKLNKFFLENFKMHSSAALYVFLHSRIKIAQKRFTQIKAVEKIIKIITRTFTKIQLLLILRELPNKYKYQKETSFVGGENEKKKKVNVISEIPWEDNGELEQSSLDNGPPPR